MLIKIRNEKTERERERERDAKGLREQFHFLLFFEALLVVWERMFFTSGNGSWDGFALGRGRPGRTNGSLLKLETRPLYAAHAGDERAKNTDKETQDNPSHVGGKNR